MMKIDKLVIALIAAVIIVLAIICGTRTCADSAATSEASPLVLRDTIVIAAGSADSDSLATNRHKRRKKKSITPKPPKKPTQGIRRNYPDDEVQNL